MVTHSPHTYLVITVFTFEDVRCVYQISFTHISIPSILPVWFQSVCSMFGAYSIPAHIHTLNNSSGFDAVFKPWNRVYMALLTSVHPAHNLLQKICLLQAAPVKKCIQLDILWDIKRSVFFMGYVVIVWYQISFEPGWLRLFQSGVALLHIRAIKYLHPHSHTYFHIGRERAEFIPGFSGPHQ